MNDCRKLAGYGWSGISGFEAGKRMRNANVELGSRTRSREDYDLQRSLSTACSRALSIRQSLSKAGPKPEASAC